MIDIKKKKTKKNDDEKYLNDIYDIIKMSGWMVITNTTMIWN